MRDAAKAKVERVIELLGEEYPATKVEKIVRCTEVASAAVKAPAHGAEYARNLLFFVNELIGRGAAERVAEALDEAQVPWQSIAQMRAAQRQLARLRSDTLSADKNAKVIPLKRVVCALSESDFTGGSYVELVDVELPINKSTGPEIVFKANGRRYAMPKDALRYVEAPMVRAR